MSKKNKNVKKVVVPKSNLESVNGKAEKTPEVINDEVAAEEVANESETEVVEGTAEVGDVETKEVITIIPEGMTGKELAAKKVLPQNSEIAQKLIEKQNAEKAEAEIAKAKEEEEKLNAGIKAFEDAIATEDPAAIIAALKALGMTTGEVFDLIAARKVKEMNAGKSILDQAKAAKAEKKSGTSGAAATAAKGTNGRTPKYAGSLTSMEKLGEYCFVNKLSEEETLKLFTEGYKLKGVTDENFIKARIAIYLNIGRKMALKAAKAAGTDTKAEVKAETEAPKEEVKDAPEAAATSEVKETVSQN